MDDDRQSRLKSWFVINSTVCWWIHASAWLWCSITDQWCLVVVNHGGSPTLGKGALLHAHQIPPRVMILRVIQSTKQHQLLHPYQWSILTPEITKLFSCRVSPKIGCKFVWCRIYLRWVWYTYIYIHIDIICILYTYWTCCIADWI